LSGPDRRKTASRRLSASAEPGPAAPEPAASLAEPDAPAGPDAVAALIARMFDADCYRMLYPDVGKDPRADPLGHFTHHGVVEGRTPSVLFDVGYVQRRLAKYEEVELPHTEVFTYYAALPADRRFVPNRWFSAWAFRRLYADRYPEVEELSDYAVFELYLDRHGYAALSPNGVFSEEHYRLRYTDVATAVGQGFVRSAFVHFIVHAAHDRRRNLPGAGDRGAAGSLTPEREVAWLLAGQEGLDPLVWWFDETFYLSVYPEVHELVRRGIVPSGLEHYLVAGFHEGRIPAPRMARHMPSGKVDDPWAFFERLGPIYPVADRLVSMEEACAILDRLDQPGWSGSRRTATETLWSYVEKPQIDGLFDAKQYLAVNGDVAHSCDGDPLRAEAHWRRFGIREYRVAPGTNLFGDRVITLQDILSWRSGVNFFGPVSAPSGLGNATRGYIAALRAAGVPVDVHDVSSLISPSLPGDLFCAARLPHSINFICLNADTVQAFAMRYGTGIFNHRANVGAWVWELTAPRPEWRAILSAFDLIVTPSKFCTDAFALTTDRPVRTIPYVVDAGALEEACAAASADNWWIRRIEAEKAAGRKIALFIMDASSYVARKGVDVFVRLAERVERKRPGEVRFVLKSHSADISGEKGERHGPEIIAVHGVFTFQDLCKLKSIADIYVSPHRSEGFGLNIIESILLGVPALCSDYAGGAELLEGNDPAPAPVRLREIGRDMGPYRAEAIWCEPDLDELEARLLAYLDGDGPSDRFRAVQARLRAELSVDAVGAKLKQELTTFCAHGGERSGGGVNAFRTFAATPHTETFRLGVVTDASRRFSQAPGANRLGEIAMEATRPFFSIVTPTWNTDPEWLRDLYDDLLHQSYPSWEWCISDDGSTDPRTLETLRELRRNDARVKLRLADRNGGISAATNAAAFIAHGKYLVMIDHDDRVRPDLLATYHDVARGEETGAVIYCDEDKIDLDGQFCESYHKPDWSPEHLLSCMYVLHCLCVRKSVFLELGGYRPEYDGAQDHDFLLRAAAADVPIRHVDQILYHWRMSAKSAAGDADAKAYAIEAGARAVGDHLSRIGVDAKVEHGLIPGAYRVRPTLPPGRVALNILTGCTRRAASRRPGRHASRGAGDTYVEQFVRSILEHAPKVDFEIRVVVDREAEAAAAPLAKLDRRVTIVPFDRGGPYFNFSEKANFAVRGSDAERVVLLNDDMQATGPDWLVALLEMLELPGVGVVGGRLVYGDGATQHCGIALGVHGAAAHLFEGVGPGVVAYNAFNQVARNYSAVTAAMIAFHRSTFDRVGGFDEDFPIDYNDVDFCLRVGAAGLRTVYTPFAELRHFESRSARRLSADGLDRLRFCERWASAVARDPYYNRNLTRSGILCEPAAA
jgi:GT2 family glycosyltransferase/glycosyltransferase involved in cell wall biosynthesis